MTSSQVSADPVAAEKNAFWLTFPKQHGAWSILLISYLIGSGVGGFQRWDSLVFFFAMLGGFFFRQAGGTYLKIASNDKNRKTVLYYTLLYFLIFSLCGIFLVWVSKLWLFIPIGGVSLVFLGVSVLLSKNKKDLTISGEITGILGLSLVAPAAEYAACGVFSERSYAVWVAGLLYFIGSIFHVRYLVRKKKESKKELVYRLRAGGLSLGYHGLALVVAVALSLPVQFLPLYFSLTLVPNTVKAFRTVLRRYKTHPAVKSIGYAELTHSLIFSLLAIATFYIN